VEATSKIEVRLQMEQSMSMPMPDKYLLCYVIASTLIACMSWCACRTGEVDLNRGAVDLD
jgi:hypothetical protein